MQNLTGGRRLSRSLRESSLGLFVLVAIALFVLLIVWLRGFSPGKRSYNAFVEFDNAGGIKQGTPVAYRGIKVGEVVGVKPQPRGVVLKVKISPSDLLIPSSAVIEANQSGLIGEPSIDISPLQDLPAGEIAQPLDRNCNPSIIICNGSRLQGQARLNVNELIRAVLRIANLVSDPEFTANVNSVAKNASNAAAGIAKLSREVSKPLKTVGPTLDEFRITARQLGLTAQEANRLLATNRSSLTTTLSNVSEASGELKGAIASLSPVLNQVKRTDILRNLETLSANAAAASANLRTFSNDFGNPNNVLLLQQTLDSARSTFENTRKITSDLDELTGDPSFRVNLRKLINGLSKLVSSTQQLQQQAEVARLLAPIAAIEVPIKESAASSVPVQPTVDPTPPIAEVPR
ncbi:MAG: MCE family protein [Tildeniella nuda ZEHNDER 1965/U140]|jgi:phospholipid/cholesterol/gamma-HCH transport system substrate-binding protein|nr:MCE family protein [Tildeniella nuda ZEHNDER 1965/U140]